LTQTDFSVIGAAKNAKNALFTETQTAEEVSTKVWNDFVLANTLETSEEVLAASKNALQDILKIIFPQLQKLNYLPREIKKSNTIHGRIKDLGLQDTLKSYAQDEKQLKKFAEKFNITDILFGMTDKPFFGAAYGLVITKTGITSRDVMEDAVTCSWGDIKNMPATISEKNDEFIAGQKRHTVPSPYAELIPTVVMLINELATGEVSL
jgi:hypothetical protein